MGTDGPLLQRINEALLDSVNLSGLRRICTYGLGITLEHITTAGDLTTMVFDLTTELDRRGRLADLVLAARAVNPGNHLLAAVAAELFVEPVRQESRTSLEAMLRTADETVDFGDWYANLSRVAARVARIEVPGTNGTMAGTAFLVGPDLLLTNQHVVQSLVDRPAYASRARVSFDVVQRVGGGRPEKGAQYTLATDWLLDASPPSPIDLDLRQPTAPADPAQLDYAVLRLAEPVGTRRSPLQSVPRGWFTRSDLAAPPGPGGPLLILQYPADRPLQLAFQQAFEVNANGTRLRHGVATDYGSSGSPCFDARMRLVALHHARDPRSVPLFNQAVPIDAIVRRLAANNLDGRVFLDE
ncbi:trypsin-like peptidase domain-containing protein [Hamadaea tsunoensis]|uniref:trypsin-like peptidase domain-containing protein n=1 Tax=Hamadaea tsunoensis TaxID=53368 RepID=UPI00041487DF|nr:trypsin-like peptidase domain-containing protein [Hamadaea tsunoensis]